MKKTIGLLVIGTWSLGYSAAPSVEWENESAQLEALSLLHKASQKQVTSLEGSSEQAISDAVQKSEEMQKKEREERQRALLIHDLMHSGNY